MRTQRRSMWAKLSEKQRAQVVALLVQILLRQVAEQQKGESS